MNTAKYIDHTLLKPAAVQADIEALCREALRYDFASVCVNPCWIETAAKMLEGSDVKVCCVIGFPLGAMSEAAKVFEAADAVKRGAQEVDMVINVGFLKDGKDDAVIHEIAAVKEAVGSLTLKVPLETCLLSEEEVVRACRDCMKGGADFVKTSTGFAPLPEGSGKATNGATVHDVKLMRESVSSNIRIKASGGIHTLADAIALIDAGAGRLGCSASVNIIEEYLKSNK